MVYTAYTLGRLEEGLAESNIAYRLDPLSPGANANLAGDYYFLGRDAETLRHTEIAWDLGHPFGKMFEGWVYFRRGDYPAAKEAFAAFTDAIGAPRELLDGLVGVRADPSSRDEFIEFLDNLAVQPEPEVMLETNILLGRFDQAFAVANERFDDFRGNAWIMIWQPDTPAFRRDPRFIKLADRLGLLGYWREGNWPDFCEPHGADVLCR